MSIESAKEFRKKMKADLGFCQNVMSYEDVEEFLEFVVKEGFDFTGQELKIASEELDKEANGELGMDELELVGGGCAMFAPCTPRTPYSYCKIQYME